MTAIANTARPRLADKARLKWDPTRGKHLLLFPEGVLLLNQTTRDILALCDGQRDISEIVKILSQQYKSNAIESDVKEVLQKLAEKSFLKMDD